MVNALSPALQSLSLAYGTFSSSFPSRAGTSLSVQELEKHIHDYTRGNGHLSRKTEKKLPKLSQKASFELAENDPKALRSFLSYQTSFTYSQQARFTKTTSDMVERLRALQTVA